MASGPLSRASHRSPRGVGTESTSFSLRDSLATWISTVLASEPGEEKRKDRDGVGVPEGLSPATSARLHGRLEPLHPFFQASAPAAMCASGRTTGMLSTEWKLAVDMGRLQSPVLSDWGA